MNKGGLENRGVSIANIYIVLLILRYRYAVDIGAREGSEFVRPDRMGGWNSGIWLWKTIYQACL